MERVRNIEGRGINGHPPISPDGHGEQEPHGQVRQGRGRPTSLTWAYDFVNISELHDAVGRG